MSKVTLQEVSLHGQDLDLDHADLAAWLLREWGPARGILLAHAYNGVVWGEAVTGQLSLTGGVALRTDTLIDLRLFDETREIRVWRKDGSLRACSVAEGTGDTYAATQEWSYLLIGSSIVGGDRVGPAGQRHRPPGNPPAEKLRVRHYLEMDRTSGLLRVAEHRYLSLH